jgi:ATP-binding protein involved in chromosome partitioning
MAQDKNQNPQKRTREQFVRPGLAKITNIIAIASGKGGVGKSTVATNLATALKHEGAKVGLMDADIYGPSQPGMLGARNEQPEISDNSLKPLTRHGVTFMSMGLLLSDDSPVIWRAPMAMKIIQQFIDNVDWGELDYLLIDLPPGTGDVQLTLTQQASLTGAVIVTTPQDIALNVARKGLKMFEQVNVPILGVIENMSGFVCKHCGKTTEIFRVGGGRKMALEFGVPFLGAIPLDPEIVMSGDSGKPLAENGGTSPSAQAFADIARRLQQYAAAEQSRTSAIEPLQIEIQPSGDLAILWPDGHQGIHKAYSLRIACPCAQCVDEDSGNRTIDPARVALGIKVEAFDIVGRYAVALKFSDSHSTGLYSFIYLRGMCECESCRSGNQKGSFAV